MTARETAAIKVSACFQSVNRPPRGTYRSPCSTLFSPLHLSFFFLVASMAARHSTRPAITILGVVHKFSTGRKPTCFAFAFIPVIEKQTFSPCFPSLNGFSLINPSRFGEFYFARELYWPSFGLLGMYVILNGNFMLWIKRKENIEYSWRSLFLRFNLVRCIFLSCLKNYLTSYFICFFVMELCKIYG